jgi:hypothetical protein
MGVVGRSVLGGWAIGLGVTGLLFGAVMVFSEAPDENVIVNILVLLISVVLVGTGPGLLIGLLVGLVRRSVGKQTPPPPRALYVPTTPADQWSAVVARCEESVRRVAAAVATVPPSPAKDWMNRIAAQFEHELEDVRGIAGLARALGAVDENHPASQRLLAAAQDFATFESEVGRVALKMFDRPELDRARTDLEFLEQQLPSLGTAT